MSDAFLIMGPPAAGKSTVAQALMRRFPRGVHIPVDDLRHMVASGLVDMSFEVDDELLAQLALAHEAAALMARTYTRAGFAAALDDFWFGEQPEAHYQRVLGTGLHCVLLRPQRAAVLERLAARGTDGDGFRPLLEQAVALVDDELERHPKTGWHVIDSTRLTVEQTVDAILHATGVQPC